ncbi:hypothetical protein GQ42DRAFT_57454 [Ramicandelaber brevisporus]|nr:hypothetical protein GQ42DRAFT_57454 [Ramicandelaber brevisporus]
MAVPLVSAVSRCLQAAEDVPHLPVTIHLDISAPATAVLREACSSCQPLRHSSIRAGASTQFYASLINASTQRHSICVSLISTAHAPNWSRRHHCRGCINTQPGTSLCLTRFFILVTFFTDYTYSLECRIYSQRWCLVFQSQLYSTPCLHIIHFTSKWLSYHY